MIALGFRKYKKRLKELQNDRARAQERLATLEESYDSIHWVGYNSGVVDHLADRYKDCQARTERDEIIECCNKVDQIRATIDDFIVNEYALKVFEEYSKKDTLLIQKSTGDILSWDKVFKGDYRDLSLMDKYALVDLAEGEGAYKLKR